MTKHPDLPFDLAQHYQQVRGQSVALCAPLQPEDVVVQPHPDVSPPKWHLGHVTWFFENFVLATYAADYALFDGRLNWVFNSYYESQGPRITRSSRGNMSRPSLSRIMDYRRHVDEAIQQLLTGEHAEMPRIQKLISLGLHHEQQHQELLLTDIKYILGNNPFYPVYQSGADAGEKWGKKREVQERHAPSAARKLSVRGGIYDIGYRGAGFCWDNELSSHQVLLQDYYIEDRPVSNAQYLEFMNDGGYERFELWQMEGIEWARGLEIKAPLYWVHNDEQWHHYTLNGGLQTLDPSLPVTHVSWYEADAYARWAEARLPTEFEWEAAHSTHGAAVNGRQNFLEHSSFHPNPTPASAPETPLDNFLGDTWEWTNSAYLPYPRYPRPEGALGEYNGKFMVNQMVLRGGSCATPRSHIRPTYRNFFQTDKRWQFTGIRLAYDGQ